MMEKGDMLFDIEEMIDRSGLQHVLELIAMICNGKADHLRENWQDARTARVWERAGQTVEKAAQSAAVIKL